MIQTALDRATHLLPAQGPLSVFVHHNTLHAFEHLPFEQAVVEAGALFDCEPYLSESRYRQEWADGRILWQDILLELDADLASRGDERIVSGWARRDLQTALLRHPVSSIAPSDVEWTLNETDFLTHRPALNGKEPPPGTADGHELWEACLAAVRGVPETADAAAPVRPRDFLRYHTGCDPDEQVSPLLIRYTAAYLDQGVSYWRMGDRDSGFFTCFIDLYGGKKGVGAPWLSRLGRIAEEERKQRLDAVSSVLRSMEALDIKPRDLEPFVNETLLALRGWAGMIHQAEIRPDRLPEEIVPARLIDFLAVRLLADRAASEQIASEHDIPLWARRAYVPDSNREEGRRRSRACTLYQAVRILQFDALSFSELQASERHALVNEIETFTELDRRRIFHRAYERQHRTSVLSALGAHIQEPAPSPDRPTYQAVFCIDDREESFRRHLEEVAPESETVGYPGFFGAAFYYRPSDDIHPTPLCPVNIRPKHELRDLSDLAHQPTVRRRDANRRAIGWISRHLWVGSRTLSRGAIVTALFGSLAILPLLLRVIAPRVAAVLRNLGTGALVPSVSTRLAIDIDTETVPIVGSQVGYTKEEMADIVESCIVQTGLCDRLSDLLIAVGHGSSSLNNPHESAYDCGACGGGRGGPNARAFAAMVNEPAVRAILKQREISIPESTWAVAAYHNTCDDQITWYAADLPESLQLTFAAAQEAFAETQRRNAHERSRRFESANPKASTEDAFKHVAGRAEDLAQVRPEYCHATVSLCLVGRRSRTRGLFLDRRAFLNSYDPTTDRDGEILAGLLAAAIPVCAGISLEYYFSHVDTVGYGCGSKLPHNISALLGVMDGHASDLRTGLSWQMVEIHEPMRLLTIVETTPDLMTRLLDTNAELARLIRNEWIQLALLDPESNELQVYYKGSFVPHSSDELPLATSPSSAAWYGNKMEHLAPAAIAGTGRIEAAG